jgi:hypothetical protein
LNDASNPFEMLTSPSWEIRRDAARLLRDIGGEQAFEALRDALDDDDMEVRVAIIEALAAFPQSETTLLDLLHDLDWEIQWAATRSLGSLWHEPLLRKIGDPHIEKRILGIESLGKRKEERFLPVLIAALDDETDVQRVAVQALAPFYDQTIMQAMQRLAEDADDEIRAMFHEYLTMRGESLPNQEDARLLCEESQIKLSYSRLYRVGTRQHPPRWLSKIHFEEFQTRIEPFEGKLRQCKQCKIHWPRYDCNEGYCPACWEQLYQALSLPDDGFFRCAYTHKIRANREKSPVSERKEQPLSHRGAYEIATLTANTPFLSERALRFLRKAFHEGYLLCERSHLFLPRDHFPPEAHYLDPCQSIDAKADRSVSSSRTNPP